jgi:hypothetical protein
VKTLEPSQTARFVRAKVHAVENVIDTTRSDGVRIRVSEALVGDDSGCVILTARGDDVDIVKKGATIEVHNGRTEVFKEYMRLAVDKWGKIISSSVPVSTVNLDNNLSNVAYEKVMPSE